MESMETVFESRNDGERENTKREDMLCLRERKSGGNRPRFLPRCDAIFPSLVKVVLVLHLFVEAGIIEGKASAQGYGGVYEGSTADSQGYSAAYGGSQSTHGYDGTYGGRTALQGYGGTYGGSTGPHGYGEAYGGSTSGSHGYGEAYGGSTAGSHGYGEAYGGSTAGSHGYGGAYGGTTGSHGYGGAYGASSGSPGYGGAYGGSAASHGYGGAYGGSTNSLSYGSPSGDYALQEYRPSIGSGYSHQGYSGYGSTPYYPRPYPRPAIWDHDYLPSFARPIEYKITLEPDVRKRTFKGFCQIELELLEPTKFLVFHADRSIKIRKLWLVKAVRRDNEDPAGGSKFRMDVVAKERHLVTLPREDQRGIVFKEELKANGRIFLLIRYQGEIGIPSRGMYVSSRTDAAGVKREIVATQTKPIHARNIFPCWDEPAFKARFGLSVIRSEEGTPARSSMPLKETVDLKDRPGMKKDVFETTPVLGATSLAMFFGSLERIEATSTDTKTIFRIHANAEDIKFGNYALDIFRRTVEAYEKMFKLPYQAKKLDVVAVPGFGVAGASEFFGMVTMREPLLLIDSQRSSTEQKLTSSLIIAHESLHHWLGDLVTPSKWKDMWLIEGPIAFWQYLGAHTVNPDFKFLESHYSSATNPALRLDALVSTNPLSTIAGGESRNALLQLFGETILNKGAGILRMVSNDVVGLDAALTGFEQLFKKFQNKNFNSDVLFGLLGEGNEKIGVEKMRLLAKPWVERHGFPLIELHAMGQNDLVLQQRRFSYNAPSCIRQVDHPLSCDVVWHVPITCHVGQGEEIKRVTSTMDSSASVVMRMDKPITFVKCNVNGNGFYRVSYSSDLWNMIINVISKKTDVIGALDRATLIGDSFAMTWFKDPPGKIQNPLDLVTALLRTETSLVVWATALEELQMISGTILNPRTTQQFKNMMSALMKPTYDKLGWTDTGTPEEKMLRGRIMAYAVNQDLHDAKTQALKLYDAWIKATEKNPATDVASENVVPPDLRIPVFVSGIRSYGSKAFDHIKSIFKDIAHPSIKEHLLTALILGANADQLSGLLAETLPGGLIVAREAALVLTRAVNNPIGQPIVWKFLLTNWNYLYEYSGLGAAVRTVIASFRDRASIDEAEAKLVGPRRAFKTEKISRLIAQGLELARLSEWWRATHQAGLSDWLTRNADRFTRR